MATTRTVTYNSVTLDAINGFSIAWTGKKAVVRAGFHIQDDAAADFRSELAAAVTALQADDKDLTISWEGTEIYDYSVSTKKAVRIRTRIDTPQENLLHRSWQLSWSAEIELPAQAFRGDTNQTGFTDGEIRLDIDQVNRPVYTFTGEYRAEPGGTPRSAAYLIEDATNGYEQRIRDWLDANALKGGATKSDSYSITSKPYTADWSGVADSSTWDGNVINFQAQARYELIPTTSGGTLSSNYTCENLVVNSARVTEWSAPGNQRAPYRQQLSCQVKVDHDLQQYDDLATLYTSEIRPWLEEHIRTAITGGVVTTQGADWILLQDAVNFNTDKNTVGVQWTVQKAPIPGWTTIVAEVQYDDDKRNRYTKWADGQNDTYSIHSPGRMLRAVESITGTYISKARIDRFAVANLFPLPGGNWNLDRITHLMKPMETELFGSVKAWLYDLKFTRHFTYVASGSGGSSVVQAQQAEPGRI